jgi:probable rRNA maturation factor
MTVSITLISGGDQLDPKFVAELEQLLNQMLIEYNLESGEVPVAIADDELLGRLNREYRNQDHPTDVLSFGYLEPGEDLPTGDCDYALGDIYISYERAVAQASETGHSVRSEIALLAVHGMLHLLGFGHYEEGEAVRMREKEALYLNRLSLQTQGDRS